MTEAEIGAILLAGGRARRMGGEDKGLIPLAGRPLVAWTLDRLVPQVSEVIINANRHLDRYAGFGHPVVPDRAPDYPGPLAGILAGAEVPRADWLLVVPCDAPFLPRDLASRLLGAAQTADTFLARAADPSQEHYAVMLLHRRLIPDLSAYLAEGGRQVQAWQARHPCATEVFTDPQAFHNINTPEDLQWAERLIKAQPA